MELSPTPAQQQVIDHVDAHCDGIAMRWYDEDRLKVAGLGDDGRPRLRLDVKRNGDFTVHWDYDDVMERY